MDEIYCRKELSRYTVEQFLKDDNGKLYEPFIHARRPMHYASTGEPVYSPDNKPPVNVIPIVPVPTNIPVPIIPVPVSFDWEALNRALEASGKNITYNKEQLVKLEHLKPEIVYPVDNQFRDFLGMFQVMDSDDNSLSGTNDFGLPLDKLDYLDLGQVFLLDERCSEMRDNFKNFDDDKGSIIS